MQFGCARPPPCVSVYRCSSTTPTAPATTVTTTTTTADSSGSAVGTRRQVMKWSQLTEINAGLMDSLTYEYVAENMPVEYEARQKDKLRYRCVCGVWRGQSGLGRIYNRSRRLFHNRATKQHAVPMQSGITIVPTKQWHDLFRRWRCVCVVYVGRSVECRGVAAPLSTSASENFEVGWQALRVYIYEHCAAGCAMLHVLHHHRGCKRRRADER